jgi:hypothetical protein
MSAMGWQCPNCSVCHAPWVPQCSCHLPAQTGTGTAPWVGDGPPDSNGPLQTGGPVTVSWHEGLFWKDSALISHLKRNSKAIKDLIS